jgi:tryptophanyl-tRNA synthetase
MQYKVELLTGIRPTSDLTVANYMGAVAPIIELQKQGISPVVFVADLHAITDNEPATVRQYIHGVVADYIALGIDPQKAKIYLQSDIAGEVTTFAALLARLVSVAELLRVPTLKDKLKNNARPETANALLLLYPVMMAADILLNRAKMVPVGEDQLAHMEVTRLLARRFNKKYRELFPIPQVLHVKALRILSLRGEGKMSKSNPGGAILLTDDAKTVASKIKAAETSFEGVMNEKLESHVLIAKRLAKTESERDEVDAIIKAHMSGKSVMGQFKQILTRIVQDFLEEFQAKRAEIMRDPSYISSVLEDGAKVARENATETLAQVRRVLQLDS